MCMPRRASSQRVNKTAEKVNTAQLNRLSYRTPLLDLLYKRIVNRSITTCYF